MKKILLLAVVLLTMFGCATYGYMAGGGYQTYEEEYMLENVEKDVISANIEKIAEELNVKVTKVSANTGTYEISDYGTMSAKGMVGVQKFKTVTFTAQENGIQVLIALGGNFDFAKKENADALLEEIKEILLKF